MLKAEDDIYKILCIYHDRTDLVERQLFEINNFTKENDIKIKLFIILDYSNDVNKHTAILSIITKMEFSKFVELNFIPYRTNLGGPFAISGAINNFILATPCKFLIIEDDILFSRNDIKDFFEAVRYWQQRNVNLVCGYPFWIEQRFLSSFPVFWFWGGHSNGLPFIDLRLRDNRFDVRYLFDIFSGDWFAITFWWLIYVRQKYIRWFHWDYALLFAVWSNQIDVGWTPIASIENKGFNSTATNTRNHKLDFIQQDETLSDQKIFEAYLGV